MLEILATVVEEPILKDIHSSVAIGLEVDESTDVSVTRQLDLHVRYKFRGKLFLTKSELYFLMFTMYLLYIFKIYGQGGAAFQPVPGPGKCQ